MKLLKLLFRKTERRQTPDISAPSLGTDIYQELEAQLNRARNVGEIISVAVIQLNAISDLRTSHGNEAATKRLNASRDLLRKLLRRSDMICDFADDRFALILPRTGPAHVEKVCNRLAGGLTRFLDDDSLIPKMLIQKHFHIGAAILEGGQLNSLAPGFNASEFLKTAVENSQVAARDGLIYYITILDFSSQSQAG